jgi:glycosyltransferase involved in cell wall biosynthesis
MRILWVKMGGLWPCTSGGRVRSLQTILALARNHEVTVVTTHGHGDDPEGLTRRLSACHQVISVPHAAPKRGSAAFAGALAGSWFSSDPVELWKWRVPEVRERVRTIIDNAGVDLCVADFLLAAANVPLGGKVPVVLFEHNVEYLIWQRLAELETSPWRRVLFEVEWRKLRAREAEACRRADLTVAVSEDDRQRLAEMAPGSRTAAIPTGVDTEYFVRNGYQQIPNRLVFSGSMDWHPNEDAVIYFADAILPRIRAAIPGVTLTVVGRNPSARLREVADRAGILVTGTVDDVRPSIGEASVYVVPLRAGGGTRLKIFEALAMSKPVVSTTVGAEGLALETGRHFVAADDPRHFADEVVSLLRDPERRRTLGQAGRRLVETHYSWATVAREFERRCEEVIVEREYARGTAVRGVHIAPTITPVIARERRAG